MPSFQVIPVPQEELRLENAEETVKELDIRKDASDLKEGTLPETFGRLDSDVVWFKYGSQEEFDYGKLDDTGTATRLEEYVIAFLGNGYIVVSNEDNDTTENLLSLIEHQFTTGISLSTTRFSEDSLRQVIEEAPETLKAQITPTDRSKPEKVSGEDRNLPDTDFWEQYGDEPLKKIKVNVDGDETEIRVGFDEYGIVILYKQKLSLEEQVAALRSLAEKQFSWLISPENFQSTLSRSEDG